jgi:HEPN domain-containing protein
MTIDASDVFETANQFRRAAKLLTDAYVRGDDYGLMAPLAATTAFTAELLLKTLLHRDSVTPPQTHDLQKLFRKLRPVHAQKVKEVFADEKEKWPYIPKIEAAAPHMRFEVDQILAATKDAFENWRYPYEEKKRLYFGLEEFCNSLVTYILELEPGWTELIT